MRYLLLISLLLSLSCSKDSWQTPNHSKLEREQTFIHYYKDDRTGICFAGKVSGWYTDTLAEVNCTPEVEKLVESLPNFNN